MKTSTKKSDSKTDSYGNSELGAIRLITRVFAELYEKKEPVLKSVTLSKRTLTFLDYPKVYVVAVVKYTDVRQERRFKIFFHMDRDQFFEWHLTEGDDITIEVGKVSSVVRYRGGEFEYSQDEPRATISFESLQAHLAACSEL